MEDGVGHSVDCSRSRRSGKWDGKVAREGIINECGRFAVWKKALGIRRIFRGFGGVANGMEKIFRGLVSAGNSKDKLPEWK